MKIKKILPLILISILLFSIVCLPAFAEEASVDSKLKINEDYQSVVYQDKIFTRIDGRYLETSNGYNMLASSEIELSEAQAQEIESIYAYYYNQALEIEISYKKGGQAYYSYIESDIYDEYTDIVKGKGYTYFIQYSGQLMGEIKYSQLLGEEKTIEGYKLNYYPGYYGWGQSAIISTQNQSGSLVNDSGYVFKDTEENCYFYVDFSQFEEHSSFECEKYAEVKLYKITDQTAISQLDLIFSDDGDYTEFEFGGLFDIIFSIISGIILSLIFGLAPLVAFIFCAVFSIIAKRPYRKFFIFAALLFALTLFLFLVLAILMIIF